MKTNELTGAALDWVVAKCEGLTLYTDAMLNGNVKRSWWVSGMSVDPNTWHPLAMFNPSTDWSQGGPIIEREKISILRLEDASKTDKDGFWIPGRIPVYGAVIGEYFNEDQLRSSCGEARGDIFYIDYELVQLGPTPLIAAMRCYVASKLGTEVEIPEELTK